MNKKVIITIALTLLLGILAIYGISKSRMVTLATTNTVKDSAYSFIQMIENKLVLSTIDDSEYTVDSLTELKVVNSEVIDDAHPDFWQPFNIANKTYNGTIEIEGIYVKSADLTMQIIGGTYHCLYDGETVEVTK